MKTYTYVHKDGRAGTSNSTYGAMIEALGARQADRVLDQTRSDQFGWVGDTAELRSTAGEILGTFLMEPYP